MRTVEYRLNQPTLHDDKLNLCPKLKHTYKPYNTFSKEIKIKVNIMLHYMKEVLCKNKVKSLEFLLKWCSNMVKGNKNNSCIYSKGPQGLGKSTLPVFLRDHVIGKDLSLETGSEPLKSHFNSILGGKLFVMFEELENFSVGEWQVISARLKRQITSNLIMLESKGIDSYEAENLNNYWLLSNNDSIKDDDGRRIFILDLATKRIGDKQFWDNIYNNCFNDEVGEAFFCYLMEIDTVGFNPQVFPMTEAKRDSFVKRLDHSYLFIKDMYIRKDEKLCETVGELFIQYVDYCRVKGHKPLCKIEFNKKLDQVGISKYKSGSVHKYKKTHSELLAIAKKNNWLHELDDYISDDESNDEEDDEELSEINYYNDHQELLELFKLNKKRINDMLVGFDLIEKIDKNRSAIKKKPIVFVGLSKVPLLDNHKCLSLLLD